MKARRAPGSAAPRVVCARAARDRRSGRRASPTARRRRGWRDRRTDRTDTADRDCSSTPRRCRSCRPGRRRIRDTRTAPPASCRCPRSCARSRRGWSPHGIARRSVPRAAFSHCASVGSLTRQPSRAPRITRGGAPAPSLSIALEPAAIGQRVGPRHERHRMRRLAGERSRIDRRTCRPPQTRVNCADGHFVPAM